jgi:hypothetical protein
MHLHIEEPNVDAHPPNFPVVPRFPSQFIVKVCPCGPKFDPRAARCVVNGMTHLIGGRTPRHSVFPLNEGKMPVHR